MAESGCLRDGHFQNIAVTKLMVNDQDVRNRLPDDVVLQGDADATLVKNTLYIINAARISNRVFTLPRAFV